MRYALCILHGVTKRPRIRKRLESALSPAAIPVSRQHHPSIRGQYRPRRYNTDRTRTCLPPSGEPEDMRERQKHKLSDTAQQIVGGFLLSGPFVVTEEVWELALNMTVFHNVFLVCVVAAIGYGGLYGADSDRDPRREAAIARVPVRFISVLIVAFGSVGILAFAVTAPDQFLSELSRADQLVVTFRAISVAAVFSVVGAVTTDSLF